MFTMISTSTTTTHSRMLSRTDKTPAARCLHGSSSSCDWISVVWSMRDRSCGFTTPNSVFSERIVFCETCTDALRGDLSHTRRTVSRIR